MAKPPTLSELKHLEDSGFAKFYPRHGLKVLYFFANDCVYFDKYKRMCMRFHPEEGKYGFHKFENRSDKDGIKLLPDGNIKYYVMGDLSRAGSEKLPTYVRADYNPHDEESDSNKGRLILGIDDDCLDKIYVTEETNESRYSKEAIFCISTSLIKSIKDLSLDKFLLQGGYLRQQEESDDEEEEEDDSDDDDDDDDDEEEDDDDDDDDDDYDDDDD